MPQTDDFGKHEVLHTAHIMASMFEDFILTHGAVQAEPDVKERAQAIADQLADFYQLCGRTWDQEKS